jgi:hypothetical protein
MVRIVQSMQPKPLTSSTEPCQHPDCRHCLVNGDNRAPCLVTAALRSGLPGFGASVPGWKAATPHVNGPRTACGLRTQQCDEAAASSDKAAGAAQDRALHSFNLFLRSASRAAAGCLRRSSRTSGAEGSRGFLLYGRGPGAGTPEPLF